MADVDNVTTQERRKYERMWQLESYRERSPGMRFLDRALAQLNMAPGATVADLGAGTGRVSAALQAKGFRVCAIDIAENAITEFDGPKWISSLWQLPDHIPAMIGFDDSRFDYGFCFDVMEHIPPERVDQTLERIAKTCRVVYFQIANFHCSEGDAIGETLHLTVEGADFWLKKLGRYFEEIYIDVQKKHHVALCVSRVY